MHGQLAQHLRSSQPKAIHLLPGEQRHFWETRGGVGKVACWWSTKAAISLKRVKMGEKLLWSLIGRNSPALFRTVPTPSSTTSCSSRFGVRKPQFQSPLGPISGADKIRTSNFVRTFIALIGTKLIISGKVAVGVVRDSKFFRAPDIGLIAR